MVNSRYRLVSATLNRSGCESHHDQRPSFSLSYGCNLPSSLARVLSSALGFSPCLPVSVCGTDTTDTPYEAFLGSLGSVGLWGVAPSHRLSALINMRLFLHVPPTDLNPLPIQGQPTLLRHSLDQYIPQWCRNIHLLPIAYALRPRLRIRLTLGGLTLPRKP